MIIVQLVSDGSWVDSLDIVHLFRSKCREVCNVILFFECIRVIMEAVMNPILMVPTRYYSWTDNELVVVLNMLWWLQYSGYLMFFVYLWFNAHYSLFAGLEYNFLWVRYGFVNVWLRIVGIFELHGKRWEVKNSLPHIQCSAVALQK